jgi:hypothetical protein
MLTAFKGKVKKGKDKNMVCKNYRKTRGIYPASAPDRTNSRQKQKI